MSRSSLRCTRRERFVPISKSAASPLSSGTIFGLKLAAAISRTIQRHTANCLNSGRPGTAREPPSRGDWPLTSSLTAGLWVRGLVERHVAGHGKTLEHDGLHAAVCWRRNACCSALSVERLKTAPARRWPTSSVRTRHSPVTVSYSASVGLSPSPSLLADDVSPLLQNSNGSFLRTLHSVSTQTRERERVPQYPQCEQRKWSNQRDCLSRYWTHK